MADFYWFSNSTTQSNWNTTGGNCRWYSGSGGTGTRFTTAPTAADNAIFDANSGTGPCNVPGGYAGTCLSLLCNGIAGTSPTTTQINGGAGGSISISGSLSVSPSQVFDVNKTPKMIMTGTGNVTISCNGNSIGDLDISKTGSASVTLNDDLIGIGNATINLISGTFNANNKNVTFGCFYTGGTTARTLNMGSGTWMMVFEGETTAITFNTWEINTTTGLTFNKDTATIKLIHAKNDPSTNSSQVSGLRNALTSGATTIDLTDIAAFNLTSGLVLIGNEVISYSGVNTGTKQLTGLTRGYGGTTTLSSVPAGTAVTGVLLGNSTLTASLTAGVLSNIGVANAALFPISGVVWIENESIPYGGINFGTNELLATSAPVNNHSIGAAVYSYQAKNFIGGGLTYNDVVFGCFGYKVINNIYSSNTFSNIKNSNSGFTWTSNSNYYPGFQELALTNNATNTISTGLSFSGTSSYLQQIYSRTAGVQTTLSISPATTLWNVGTHSQNGGNNTNLYYVAGFTDYIYWKDIIGLPTSISAGNFFLLF